LKNRKVDGIAQPWNEKITEFFLYVLFYLPEQAVKPEDACLIEKVDYVLAASEDIFEIDSITKVLISVSIYLKRKPKSRI
jgi:hypothetical protein